MDCFPADIELKLGFDIVRTRLTELADTELGRSEIGTLETLSDRASVEYRLALIGEWRESIESGEQPGLHGVPDLLGLLTRIRPAGSWATPEEALDVVSALRTARLVKSYFSSRSSAYPNCAIDSSTLEPDRRLETAIGDLFDESGDLRDGASPELRKIRKQITNTELQLRRTAAEALNEAQAARFAAGDEPTIRAGRTVIPIKAEAKRKLTGIIVDTSATGQTVFVEPQQCIDLNNERRLLEGQERREIVRILEGITDEIRERRSSLERNQHVLIRFDVIRACARLGIELSAIVPTISDDGLIDIRSGLNVALTLVRRKSREPGHDLDVVPLDLSLSVENAVLLISGPNAGGKSVAMKTIGLFALMLAHGLPLPADEGTAIPLYDRLCVDIGDEQSIETDLSTFSSHLQRLKHIVESSDEGTLVLIDELGTATDPTAGAAIAQAVMEHLVRVGATAIVTTHFGALKAFADEAAGVANGAMMFDRDNLSPTYVFEPGIPGSSFAFQIAERTSFPPAILSRAQELAGSEESTMEDLLAKLEFAKRRAVEEEALLAKRLSEAEDATQEARDARQRIVESRDKILAMAEERAESLLKEANRTIERTVREIREAQAERKRTVKAREQITALRDTIKAKAEIRKRRRPADPRPTEPGRPLARGDQVVLDGGEAVGEVESIEQGSVIVTFGSMQTRVASSRLTRVGGAKRQEVQVSQARSTTATDGALPAVRRRQDVRGYRVAEAIPEVEKFIYAAVRDGLGRVEILHGTGTGALRMALQEHLKSMIEVDRVSDAPIEQGGAGVSIVILH